MPRYRRIRLRSQKVVFPEDSSPKHHETPWSQHEDQSLIELVDRSGSTSWDRISSLMGRRTPEQCRERYQQVQEPTLEHAWVCVSNIKCVIFWLLTIFQSECGGVWYLGTTGACLACSHIRCTNCPTWDIGSIAINMHGFWRIE